MSRIRTPSLHRCGGVYPVSHGDVATNPDPESPHDDLEDDVEDKNAKTRETNI